ncbi:MAG: very short patch repair endonuclease [Candidatus Binatia bacterium]
MSTSPQDSEKPDEAVAKVRTVRGLPYPYPESGAASHAVRANRKSNTRPEKRLRALLHRNGYRFRKDLTIQVPGLRVRPDIVFTRQRIAVFIDGCFWHRCPEHGSTPRANSAYWGPKLDRNVERDRLVDERLREAGWLVVRIWEHVSPEEASGLVAAIVSKARKSN